MERGFEQLIVIAAIIIAGLFDVLARWLKSRQQKGAPVDATEYEEDPGLVEEGADFEQAADTELSSDIELSREEQVERALSREEQLQRALSREEQVERALSREELVERAQLGEELVQRRVSLLPPPARVPLVSRRPAPAPSRPQRVSRRLLANPVDARRGIIMMTILGPCRGLERPDNEAT